MLKYLRIAVTALSLTACVLLIALWVRSYWRTATIYGPILGSGSFYIHSIQGQVRFCFSPQRLEDFDATHWGYHGGRLEYTQSFITPEIDTYGGFAVQRIGDRPVAVVPHWALIVLIATLTVAPWIHWSRRFSLRTLLIATTLVAVGLGAIVVFR